jgi:8-amino-7-oxononanoate synthase
MDRRVLFHVKHSSPPDLSILPVTAAKPCCRGLTPQPRHPYGRPVLPSLDAALRSDLVSLEAQHRIRFCPAVAGVSRTSATVDDQPLLSFCSNDYLGLADHPALASAAAASAARSGIGSGASRLVAGDLPEHRELEAGLSTFLGVEAVLLFPSGYQTNLGVLPALAGPGDLVLCDHANHASIIDACRLSRARISFYRHIDVSSAEQRLVRLAPTARRKLIVTESLFSMGGDIAPLADLAALAKAHGAALIVDEAHALGALGPGGRGLCRDAGVTPDILIGTLGKAFGTAGGFAAGTRTLREYLVNHSRTFMFTTAPPPLIAAAALAALNIVRGPEGEARRLALASRVRQLRGLLSQLPAGSPGSPIFPILLGTDRAALDASRALRTRGFFVQAIRPPTVPDGSARLRITLSANHRPGDVDSLAQAIGPLIPQ